MLFYAGNASVLSQQYDTALILYKKYLLSYPTDSSALYNTALMSEANEHYKSAIKYYEIYLQNTPNYTDKQAILDKIILLKKDYEIFLAYCKKIIQSDLGYLERHYQLLLATPNAVPLAGEFAGFIIEKYPFYAQLPDIMEIDEPWFKQYSKEITQGLKGAVKYLFKPSWDMNGITAIGMIYEPMKRLTQKLK